MGVAIVVALIALVAYASLRAPAPPTGEAPDFTFTDLAGLAHSLSSYRGHPVVLWWITTFCGSCAQGTQSFAQNYYASYHGAGVQFLELESYNDLGQSGPTIAAFASQNGYADQSGWVMGEGSAQGTSTYNPNSELDLYTVIDSHGVIISSGQDLPGSFSAVLSEAQGT